MGFSHDGGYGPYMLIHENIFFPIPSDLTIDATEATLLLDIMGTGGHAMKRARVVHPDVQSVLVLGAGPIGLGVLAMAKLLLGQDVPVYITDIVDARLKLAESLGGIPLNVRDATLGERLNAAGGPNLRADVAIDTSGRTEARQAGLEALGKRGVFVCVGHGGALNLNVSGQMIALERAVLGSEYFCFNELPQNAELLRALFTFRTCARSSRIAFHISEMQPAYELFFAGSSGKVVIEQ